ncbi:MAG TPA: hypothetical protein VJA94_25300 [Candidatus Angelobacter sp.]
MGNRVSPEASAERLERIKAMFRKALGRELTAEEQRYLGLASTAESTEEVGAPKQDAEPFKRAKSA